MDWSPPLVTLRIPPPPRHFFHSRVGPPNTGFMALVGCVETGGRYVCVDSGAVGLLRRRPPPLFFSLFLNIHKGAAAPPPPFRTSPSHTLIWNDGPRIFSPAPLASFCPQRLRSHAFSGPHSFHLSTLFPILCCRAT